MDVPLVTDFGGELLGPLSVFPCQVGVSLFATARLHGEARLQLAVLEDAALTFHRCVGRTDRRSLRLFMEVDEWFASESTDGPFAFVTICDTLNINPEYIRRKLREWRTLGRQRTSGKAPFRRQDVGRSRVVSEPLVKVA